MTLAIKKIIKKCYNDDYLVKTTFLTKLSLVH